jgi:hypothetical protein
MDARNYEMVGYAGHVNKVVPFAPPPAGIPITGNCLEGELRLRRNAPISRPSS